MFCAEGYQAVLNETSTLTCACDRCDNNFCLSFGIDFSECFSLSYNETCVIRYLVGDTGAGDRNVTEFFRGSNGHVQGSLEPAKLSTIRLSAECVLRRDDHFVQTDGDVSGTQVQTTAEGRVEQPSRKWRTKRFCNTKWRVSVVSYEVANEGLWRTDGTRGGRLPS